MGTEHDDLWTWAEEHHGLVRSDELFAAPMSVRARNRLVCGPDVERLSTRVFRRVGSPRTPHQATLAAVLDAGSGVAVAGMSAAWLWRLPGFEFTEPVELTRARSVSHPSRPTIGRVKERRALPDDHITAVDGIPVIILPVLLFQLAGSLRDGRFIRAADTVVGRSPAVLHALHDLLPTLAARGRNGIGLMRAYLAERPAGARVPTGLERRFEKIVEEAGLAPLRRQVDVGGHSWIGRVDYLDDALGLVVEIQSATYHSSVTDRRVDDRRAAALLAAGFRGVLQVDEDAIWYRPRDAVGALRRARAALGPGSVAWRETPGARFQATEGEGGRMSA